MIGEEGWSDRTAVRHLWGSASLPAVVFRAWDWLDPVWR